VNEAGITRRYVRALHGVAMETGVTLAKAVLTDLHWFAALLAEDPHLKTFLADPRVPATQKKATLEKALPGDLKDLTRDFLLWMVERGRASLVRFAAAEYEALLREEQGVAIAEVTSAARLDPDDHAALSERLEAVTGKQIKMVTQVDSALLGGLKVRIGSLLFDGSLRRQLEDLRKGLRVAPLPAPAALDFDALFSAPGDNGHDEQP